MKKIILLISILVTGHAFGQSVSVMDFVKIKDNKKVEAFYFYEHNWKVYREMALEKGFIKSYRMLTVVPDSANNYDLILITEFADSTQYKLTEEHFQPIIKATRPNGPLLLNDLKPADFRQNVSSKTTQTLFEGKETIRKDN